MTRLAHFSDIHITSPKYEWRLGDWFSKRLTSWANHRFARGRHFGLAEEIVNRLMEDLPARGVDHLVFSNTSARQRFSSFQAAHLTLIQSRVGPETYGRSSRFETIPSRRISRPTLRT